MTNKDSDRSDQNMIMGCRNGDGGIKIEVDKR